jgi:hypothetical protein
VGFPHNLPLSTKADALAQIFKWKKSEREEKVFPLEKRKCVRKRERERKGNIYVFHGTLKVCCFNAGL